MKQFNSYLLVLLLLIFINVHAIAQPTTTGLVAYFNLNGNTTNTGSANITASTVNTSYTTNSLNSPNTALQLGGNLNSYVDFVDNGNLDFSGTNNFTVSFFFFFNGSSTSGLIDNCLNYNGWGVWLWSTVNGVWNLQFNYRNNSVGSAAATAFTTNAWHHVAAVRNNGTISLYIDGAFRLSASEGTGTPSYPINMIAGAMAYGAFSPPRYNPYGGKIDEIRIYNRALSAAEILVLSGAVTLPLTLGEFNVVKKSGGNLLRWQTLKEQNTSHFEIEKSSNARNWINIGRVNASGNSNTANNYQHTDGQINNATVFYRLKMYDIDNSFIYSKVLSVKATSDVQFAMFPNPTDKWLNLQITSAQDDRAQLLIIDALGRQVHRQQLSLKPGVNSNSIPVSDLKAGTYYLLIEGSNMKQRQQFVKQ